LGFVVSSEFARLSPFSLRSGRPRVSGAQQVHQQGNEPCRAKHEQQRAMPVEKSGNKMNVSTQVVSAETPAARPQERAGDVVRSESPPRHLQNSGNDTVQLPQAVEKAGQENNYSAVALEKIIEVLLSLRVDLELVQRGPSSPAADGVADAVAERGRSRYEDEEQRDAHPSLSGL